LPGSCDLHQQPCRQLSRLRRPGQRIEAVIPATRCRRPWPAPCAVAISGRRGRSRRRSGGPSACVAAGASGTFFSQRFGQLRSADRYALTRLDLGNETRNRPVGPVGTRAIEERCHDGCARLAAAQADRRHLSHQAQRRFYCAPGCPRSPPRSQTRRAHQTRRDRPRQRPGSRQQGHRGSTGRPRSDITWTASAECIS
jgi:hypothetical protein